MWPCQPLSAPGQRLRWSVAVNGWLVTVSYSASTKPNQKSKFLRSLSAKHWVTNDKTGTVWYRILWYLMFSWSTTKLHYVYITLYYITFTKYIYIYIYVQFSPLVSHGISPGNPGVFTFFWPFPLSKPPGQDCRRAHGAAWVPLVPLATKGLDDLFGDRGFQQKRHFFWGENIYLLGTVQDFYVGKKS